MGEKKRTLRGFLCAALGGVCWGASGTVGQYLFTCQGVDSGWLTVVRMFLAGVVLLGADENLGEVMQVELLAGALPSQAQVEARAAVAVVGDELAERLYGRVNITGREIRISRNGREQIFTVCGVMRAQTGALGGALSAIAPELIYVPYGLLAESGERADQVFVSCAADADPDAVGRSISRYLETRGQVTGTVYVLSLIHI